MATHLEAFTKGHLQAGETVAAGFDGIGFVLVGAKRVARRGALVITPVRAVFYRSGFFGGESLHGIQLASVTSVEHSRFLGYSKLILRSSSDLLEFRSTNKEVIGALMQAIEQGRAAAR